MLYDKLQSNTYFFGYNVYDKTYFIKTLLRGYPHFKNKILCFKGKTHKLKLKTMNYKAYC